MAISPVNAVDVSTTAGISTTGWVPQRDLSFAEWEEVGHTLQHIGRAWQWWVGDWLNYGEAKYGETYAQAIDITGLGYDAVANAAWVAAAINSSTRVETLSWTHHRLVAHLDSERQRFWLERAQREGLSSRELQAEIQASRITDTSAPPPLPVGKHHVIEADPPWAVPSGPKGPGHQYALMSTDAICAMADDVSSLAADDCHLYLWATNTLLPDAFQVMQAWGFEYRTILTWVKPRIGLGHHFRTTTEHVLFGTRGKLDTLVNDQPTHFEMPAGRHSEKPAGFYELIERCSPGPYVRLFARDQREGWTSWGAEA